MDDHRPVSEPARTRRANANAHNWRGTWTLYVKEVQRFVKVITQTILAPMITTLLFLAIFTLALGRAVESVGGLSFAEFLAPGLIMMAMMQNAFANTSSSVVISKVQGNIVDVLMPPLGPMDLCLGYVLAGVTRGIAVGLAVGVAMAFFVDMRIASIPAVLYFGIMASAMLGLLGLLGGIWADKFDHIAAVTNFVVTPLTFLSGTFYSTERLPELWRDLSHLNPFFYAIDGFRYGLTGRADGDLWVGAGVLLAVNVALCWAVLTMLRSGYKLKA